MTTMSMTPSSPSPSSSSALLHPLPPTPQVLQSWLQRHVDLLLSERQAELDESHLLLSSTSPRLLEANGLALCRLGVLNTSVGMGGKRLVELHRPAAYHSETTFPPNGFRSGDVVVLVDEAAEGGGKGKGKEKSKEKNEKGGENQGVEGVVVRITESKIVVAVRGKKGGDDEGGDSADDLPSRCRVVKVANEVTWERMERNLVKLADELSIPIRTSRGIRGNAANRVNDVQDSSDDEGSRPKHQNGKKLAPASKTPLPSPPESIPPLTPLLSVLLGLKPPSPIPTSLPEPPLTIYNTSLNEIQRQALSRALCAKELHLIHGPPGTGKTTLLVELVLQLVLGKGERILVAGSSNLAVDNLAARLLHFRKGREKDLRAVRIGHPARILPILQNHTLDHLSTSSDAGSLLADTRSELQAAYASLSTGTRSSDKPSAGNKSNSKRGSSSQNHKRLTGSERKKAWEDVRGLRKELREREHGLFTSTLSDANIVMSTLHGAAGGVLERSLRPNGDKEVRKFDTVIVDEACQALEASTWGAVLDTCRADGGRLILAGDDKQLGPVVKSEDGHKKKKGPQNKKKERSSKEARKDRKSGAKGKEEDVAVLTEAAGAVSLDTTTNEAQDGDTSEEADGAADGTSPEGDTVSLAGPSTNGQFTMQRPQLRPPKSLNTTLFTRLIKLYGNSTTLKSLLTIQYRMNSLIMAYPNEAMYEGKLIAHDSCKEIWLGDGFFSDWKGASSEVDEIKGGKVIFYDTAGSEMYENTPSSDSSSASSVLDSDSKSNAHEAEIVSTHLRLLFEAGIPSSAITILAPYSAQVSLLSTTLHSSLPASASPQALEIGTIDALQGREKDVVIISLTRSNEEGQVGFLSEVRRLNVAMTRAKRQLVVVGDSETVAKGGKYLAEWMQWLEENAVIEPVLP